MAYWTVACSVYSYIVTIRATVRICRIPRVRRSSPNCRWAAALRVRGRYESEAAGGVKESAGEPAQLQAGQFSGCEPGELAELAIAGCRGTADDPGFIEGGDVGGAVAAGVADLAIGTDTDGTSSSSCPTTARSLAMCAAIPTWVTLRSGAPDPDRSAPGSRSLT